MCRIKPSGVHGVGVFAIKDILSGTYVFPEADPEKWIPYSKKELKDLDEEIKNMIEDYFITKDGYTWVSRSLNKLDVSYFMNHSDTPNIKFNTIMKNGDLTVTGGYAIREIRKGEELLINYNDGMACENDYNKFLK